MKKLLLLFMALLIAFSCASCNIYGEKNTETFVDPTYSVTLNCPDIPELDGNIIEVTWGKAYNLPIPTKENYNFNGWYTEKQQIQTNGIWFHSADVNVIPKWSATEYEIYCEMRPYLNDLTITYNVESNDFSLPIPKHVDNLVFVGWSDGHNSSPTKVVKISSGSFGDQKYTANWESINNFSLYEIPEAEDEEKLENYFIFEIVDNHAVVKGYYGETGAEHLVIPREYNGYPVTAIGEEAFFGMGKFTELLSFPSTITSIENHAIGECKGLPMNVLDENLERLDDVALNAWIEQVYIGENNGGLNNLK